MHETENQHRQDASTEPQRQALDDMSRQLVQKLNDMVREQHERARRFAATQHSLSPLPGLPEIEGVAEPPTTSSYTPQPAASPARPQQKKAPILPPRPAAPKEPQKFDAHPVPETQRPEWLEKARESHTGKKADENGCATFPTLVFIIILVIIFRSCS